MINATMAAMLSVYQRDQMERDWLAISAHIKSRAFNGFTCASVHVRPNNGITQPRALGVEDGAITLYVPHEQYVGEELAERLMQLDYGVVFDDCGPVCDSIILQARAEKGEDNQFPTLIISWQASMEGM